MARPPFPRGSRQNYRDTGKTCKITGNYRETEETGKLFKTLPEITRKPGNQENRPSYLNNRETGKTNKITG